MILFDWGDVVLLESNFFGFYSLSMEITNSMRRWNSEFLTKIQLIAYELCGMENFM